MGSKQVGGRRERRAFSAEFKAEAVRRMQEGRAAGRTLTQVGRELDVRPDQLRGSARQRGEASPRDARPTGETLEQENRRLRREVATLQQEQAFLKIASVDSRGQRNTSTSVLNGDALW